MYRCGVKPAVNLNNINFKLTIATSLPRRAKIFFLLVVFGNGCSLSNNLAVGGPSRFAIEFATPPPL
jgi:hypothetical protein